MRIGGQPFVLITTATISGILINFENDHTQSGSHGIALLTGILLLIYFIYSALIARCNHPAHNLLLVIGFILFGYIIRKQHNASAMPDFSTNQLENTRYFSARIDSKGEKAGQYTRFRITVQGIREGSDWNKTDTKALLNVSDSVTLSYGDDILVKSSMQFLQHQTNPHAFDYARFLERKGFYIQSFCKPEDIILFGSEKKHVRYLALRTGDFLEAILSKYIGTRRELNMTKAMVIGRRYEVSPEMEAVYAATGTSHILAVSGLHVGIIYLIFARLFRFARRKGRFWLYYGSVLLAIWCFAFITGLSPSVWRASLMFSFILIGEAIGRKNNIYNSIFASAFCVLFIEPNLIYSVSFQFSYMAVLGIVYYYKAIYNLIYVKNRFIDFFWQITALSFSVQLATAPISIFYFHQFPVIFPVTNLVAIPTAMVVVGGSMALFFTAALPVIPTLIGTIMQYWMVAYNSLMYWFGSLRFASIEHLWIREYHVFFILLLIFLLFRFADSRRIFVFRLFTYSLMIFSAIVLYDYYSTSGNQRLIVYAINRQFCTDLMLGRTCYSNYEMADEQSEKDFQYTILPSRKHHLISENKAMNEIKSFRRIGENQLFVLNGKTFLVFNQPIGVLEKSVKIQIDYLFIGSKGLNFANHIRDHMEVEQIIADPTITHAQFAKLNMIPARKKTHRIRTDGAFILDI